jgi:hypothetical protein
MVCRRMLTDEEVLSAFGGRNEAEALIGDACDRSVVRCH